MCAHIYVYTVRFSMQNHNFSQNSLLLTQSTTEFSLLFNVVKQLVEFFQCQQYATALLHTYVCIWISVEWNFKSKHCIPMSSLCMYIRMHLCTDMCIYLKAYKYICMYVCCQQIRLKPLCNFSTSEGKYTYVNIYLYILWKYIYFFNKLY